MWKGNQWYSSHPADEHMTQGYGSREDYKRSLIRKYNKKNLHDQDNDYDDHSWSFPLTKFCSIIENYVELLNLKVLDNHSSMSKSKFDHQVENLEKDQLPDIDRSRNEKILLHRLLRKIVEKKDAAQKILKVCEEI
uniref:Uncharacterized protein n=1 Tax=Romanomermis culicivorax TaxID=13658 RepID=A0A915JB66_ROMCU